jgi:hypothetical protein
MIIAGSVPVVPFSPPKIGRDEIAELIATIESGWLSTGPRVSRFEAGHHIPVATIHDLDLARMPSDLQIDGRLTPLPGSIPAELPGPELAILDPSIPETRARKPPRAPHRVLITLDGGAHVRTVGAARAPLDEASSRHAA